jgi:hypothetical protein
LSQIYFIFKFFWSILLILSIIGKTYKSLVQNKSIKLSVKYMKNHHRQLWQNLKALLFWQQFFMSTLFTTRILCNFLKYLILGNPGRKLIIMVQCFLIANFHFFCKLQYCCHESKYESFHFVKAVCDDFSCTSPTVLWTYFGPKIHKFCQL